MSTSTSETAAHRGGAGGLRRFRAPAPPRPEHCELCDAPLPPRHRHLVDTRKRSLACACAACTMLFSPTGEGGGRFRAVPDRCLSDPRSGLAQQVWARLGIPVSTAFFFRNSELGRLVALYPSPAGATESEVDPAAWQAAFGASPLAAALLPDVEALLVRRTEEGTACFLVPVDAVYELVGRLRLHWKGFDGGSEARAALDAFFGRLEQTAVDVSRKEGTG